MHLLVFRFIPYLALSLLVAIPLLGSQSRAQYWKPIHTNGAQRLSLDELHYLVLPEHNSKQFSRSIEDLQALYSQRFERSLEVVEHGRAKQTISFEISTFLLNILI